ncbi:hypothetical protein [Bacillus coreaensis]
MLKLFAVLMMFLLVISGCSLSEGAVNEGVKESKPAGESVKKEVEDNEQDKKDEATKVMEEETKRLDLKTKELNLATDIMKEAEVLSSSMLQAMSGGLSLEDNVVVSIANNSLVKLDSAISELNSLEVYPEDEASRNRLLEAINNLELFMDTVRQSNESGSYETLLNGFDFYDQYVVALNNWDAQRD